MAPHTTPPGRIAASVPLDLRALPGWLCWRLEDNPNPALPPLKVPYYVNGRRRGGRQGTPEDRSQLVDFETARVSAGNMGMSGVGLALMPEFGVTALDFDKCVGPGTTAPPEVSQLIARTYVEYSPSGTGLRAFVLGDYGNRKSRAKDSDHGFETFASSGFVTVTGNALPAVRALGHLDTIAAADEIVRPLCEARFGARDLQPADPDDFMLGHEPRLGLDVARMEELLAAIDPDVGRDAWIRVGMALHHETEGDDTGFDLWNDWSAEGGKYPGDEALRQQWDSFERRKGERRRQVTMATVIRMAQNGDLTGGLSEDDLRAIMDGAAPAAPGGEVRTPPEFGGKYPIVSPAMLSSQKPMQWLVKGVVPVGDLVVLYGASGAGKTFVALDLAASMARGVDWRGHRTKRARVVYIAAEGGAGIGKRLKAYCRHHSCSLADLDIGVLTAAPNFLDNDDVSAVAEALAACGGCDVLFIDTLAQVTPGANENAGEDMGKVLRNIRTLRAASGAVPVLVHHAGKDLSRGSRGWSGLRAAADAEIEVLRHEDGQREIRLAKMKDGDDGLRWGFKLEVYDLEMDEDGDSITSCVAVEASAPVAEAKGEEKERKNVVRYGHLERHVLEVIEIVWPTAQSARLSEVVDKAVEMLPAPDPGKRDQRKYNVQRAVHSLAKRKDGPIAVERGLIIFCT